MRENRTYGLEGGAPEGVPTPIKGHVNVSTARVAQ
jgi:hypothetical protein